MVDMSDTPAGWIARLDADLARRGRDIILRKSNTATGQITVKAKVRGYRPDEVTGIIVAGDSKVIISATGLETFGVPPSNGFAVWDGVPRRIIVPTPIYDGNTLVRVELQVRG